VCKRTCALDSDGFVAERSKLEMGIVMHA
jgi:hypothetical protein